MVPVEARPNRIEQLLLMWLKVKPKMPHEIMLDHLEQTTNKENDSKKFIKLR